MKKYVILVVIALALGGCKSRPNNYECVDKIVTFVSNQKDSCQYYTEEDWDNANRRYLELLIEAQKYNDYLSISEKNQIVKASTTYVFMQMHRDPDRIKEILGNIK